ncbi:hypothetical protein Tco_0227811 [Tanacetum coccineum]
MMNEKFIKIINEIQIKDYRNEKIDIQYRRECEIKIDELKQNFNGMSIEIRKKEKELLQQEQAAYDKVLDDIISIPPGNGNDHYNAESSLIESVINRDNVISSPKIDFLLEEFTGELALITPIPSGIVEADFDPKGDIRFIENLIDDDSYENINYVDALPPDAEIVSLEVVEIVIPEVGGIDTDVLLTIKNDILREKLLNVNLLIANIEALKDNPAPSSDVMTKSSSTSLNLFLRETNTFDNSSPEAETFCFEIYGSTQPGSDIPLRIMKLSILMTIILKKRVVAVPLLMLIFFNMIRSSLGFQLIHFLLPIGIEPELGNLTMDVVNDIFPTREPRVHVHNVLPTHPTLDTDFILLSEPLFAYIVWIFLPFLTYPVAPPYLLSCGNEDIIFDPGISIYHSFMPGVSHRKREACLFPSPCVVFCAVLSRMSRIFEASRAHGICPSITRASQSSASFGNPIS